MRARSVARSTIDCGLKELDESEAADKITGKIRRAGGGRQSLTQKVPTLLDDLRKLVEPATLRDPERALIWAAFGQDAGVELRDACTTAHPRRKVCARGAPWTRSSAMARARSHEGDETDATRV